MKSVSPAIIKISETPIAIAKLLACEPCRQERAT